MGRRIKPKAIKPQLRVFQCEECETKVVTTKWRGRSAPGHVKHMWCYCCKKETQHNQVE